MSRDGGLRGLFAAFIKRAHWCPVETWSTGQGVPDANYCLEGSEGWIEFKLTEANAVALAPEQVGWIERRTRAGGRCFVAVRRKCVAGPRRVARDELQMFRGKDVRVLSTKGLVGAQPIGIWTGGPKNWDWSMVTTLLTQ
jgi:hypothetical protein